MRCRRVGEGVLSTQLQTKVRKGLWSPEEDYKLANYIMKNGLEDSWTSISKQAGKHPRYGLQRCGKSCRLRWMNYLRPDLKRGAFSCQEERLIIRLQSILGNRWSQIAGHMPGRTDNEIKNYWNSSIKKKLLLKQERLYFSPTSNGNAESNIPSQADLISNNNTNSVSAYDTLRSSHSAQPYLEIMPEGNQPPINTFNVMTTGENRLCVPEILELENGQVQVQNAKVSTDPDTNELISYFHLWIDATSTHTHQRQTPHETPASGDYSTASTVPADFIDSSQSLLKEFESHGDLLVDENEITIDYSSFTAASSGYSYLYAADCSHVIDPGAYTTHETGISIIEDYDKITTRESCGPLNSGSQFCAPAEVRWSAGQCNDFQAKDDSSDRLNLGYDGSLAIPMHDIVINNMQRSHQLLEIDGRGGVGHQRDFSRIPSKEANVNPIPVIFS